MTASKEGVQVDPMDDSEQQKSLINKGWPKVFRDWLQNQRMNPHPSFQVGDIVEYDLFTYNGRFIERAEIVKVNNDGTFAIRPIDRTGRPVEDWPGEYLFPSDLTDRP